MTQEEQEEQEESEEEDWERARIIFGKLKDIDRAQLYASVEYKDEYDEWVVDSFSLSALDPDETKGFLSLLGRDAYITVIDGAITKIRRA